MICYDLWIYNASAHRLKSLGLRSKEALSISLVLSVISTWPCWCQLYWGWQVVSSSHVCWVVGVAAPCSLVISHGSVAVFWAGGEGRRGVRSLHSTNNCYLCFHTSTSTSPSTSSSSSGRTFLEPAGRGGWGGGHHISHTQYTPVLTCTPVHTAW